MTPRQVGNVMADAYTGWQKETYAALLNRFSLPEGTPFSPISMEELFVLMSKEAD